MQSSSSTAKRNFTLKDKQKLLANLDIEGTVIAVQCVLDPARSPSSLVEHRTKQLEAWLSDAIESFRSRNEGYLSRIPRIVLGVKMRDLEAKYNGDVLTCMKVLQMDRLAEGAAGVERSTKKRKWFATQDVEPERSNESSRAIKNRKCKYAAVHPFCSVNTCHSSNFRRNSPQNDLHSWLPLSYEVSTPEDARNRKTSMHNCSNTT